MGKIKLTKRDILEIEKERIKSLYNEGYSVTEILEFVNLSYGVIYDYLKKEGLIKSQKSIMVLNSEKTIIKLFNEGKTAKEITFELHLPATLVSLVLKKNNLIRKKYYYGEKEFDSAHIMRQYQKDIAIKVRLDHEKGKSLKQLKEDYKISMQSVKHIITRAKNEKDK